MDYDKLLDSAFRHTIVTNEVGLLTSVFRPNAICPHKVVSILSNFLITLSGLSLLFLSMTYFYHTGQSLILYFLISYNDALS